MVIKKRMVSTKEDKDKNRQIKASPTSDSELVLCDKCRNDLYKLGCDDRQSCSLKSTWLVSVSSALESETFGLWTLLTGWLMVLAGQADVVAV